MTDRITRKDPASPILPAEVDRRGFLAAGAGLAAAASIPATVRAIETAHLQPVAEDEPPVPAGINIQTIVEGEKLVGVSFNDAKRQQILKSIDDVTRLYDVVRGADLENGEGPAEVFDPRLRGMTFPTQLEPARHRAADVPPISSNEEDIAYAPIAHQAHWLRTGQTTSEALTKLSIKRFKSIGPKLESVITLLEAEALDRARNADRELAHGVDRGWLHGLPYGVKDLIDTRNIRTTWGAEPFKDRIASRDAAVVRRLNDAGAVLVAKLTLGALAYGDIWFGGKTRNPWKLEQGSSGSSAGSAASVAAGLCAFTLGTETYGSIMSPSTRCGATGFRPTYGRVSRDGAMALCWSLDKIGPICRSADDCAHVLDVINGLDPADESTVDIPLNLDMTRSLKGLRIGYLKSEFDDSAAAPDDARMLAILQDFGGVLIPKEVAPAPYGGIIFFLISVEGAAAFDVLTRSNRDELMKWQADSAWPNTFRTTRFASVVDFMNARRLRRRYMKHAHELFADIDVLIAPRRHGALHALTNMTGQPALTIRQGFRDDGTPFSTNLWAPLYKDNVLLAVGSALERELGLWQRRPPLA